MLYNVIMALDLSAEPLRKVPMDYQLQLREAERVAAQSAKRKYGLHGKHEQHAVHPSAEEHEENSMPYHEFS